MSIWKIEGLGCDWTDLFGLQCLNVQQDTAVSGRGLPAHCLCALVAPSPSLAAGWLAVRGMQRARTRPLSGRLVREILHAGHRVNPKISFYQLVLCLMPT